ncbi:MAG: hypothetical protein M1832_005801 [Thelocarpon impressellum]|nr:MAG: hypothetical protein M1832_005801 [Thelocarpon impressellum]
MDTQPSRSLTRRWADTQLMPPPPAKRIKRPPTVLDEDTYTDAISDIIARDFFPGLLETRTQQEYLDALGSRDGEWISRAGRRLTQVMTPGPRRSRRGTSLALAMPLRDDTPRGHGGDTPMSVTSTASTDTAATQTPPVDLNLSLDNFQAKYTSEDNESFNRLLDRQNQKRAESYAWLWAGNKIPAARQIKQRERQAKLLKEAKGETALARVDEDERKAMPDGWKAKPDNEFMFAPDGIEDRHETVQQAAEARSRAPPKAVVYDNTRLPPPQPEPLGEVAESPSMSAVDAAIAGRPRPTASEPGYSGGETPRVNGYPFVDDEPTPSEVGTTDAPLLLGSGDTTPNPFKIKEQSKRESLHRRMVDRVAKNNRPTARPGSVASMSASNTPVPKFASSPRPGAQLTPAAQRLWSKVGSTPGRGVGGVFDGRHVMTGKGKEREGESGLRLRWTPTPKAKRSEG